MNETSQDPSLCNSTNQEALIVLFSTAGLSCTVCIAAIVSVCAMKLYRKLIYRLASYQVIGALAYSVVELFQLLFINYEPAKETVCVAIASLDQLFLGIKLLLTAWITFHLFCFAVLYKNMKKLEIVYVLSSIAVPLVAFIVPFTTKTYGLAGSWCWIRSTYDNCTPIVQGIAEQFGLFYGPAIVSLLAETVAMVIILLVLTKRKRNTLLGMSQIHDQALTRMLPLASYPLIFCVLVVPPMAYRAYMANGVHTPILPTQQLELLLAASFFHPFWGFAAGVALLFHVLCVLRKRRLKVPYYRFGEIKLN